MADDDRYLIKRYSNRKLYDSVRRRFTTLDEVSKLVDAGIRVLVRDHDTGADRTDEVLAQVLGRRVRSAGSGGSDVLAGLLRTPGKVARTVADEISPASDSTDDEAEPVAPAADESAAAAVDQQQEEIRELRDQVSQLTEAVTLLLQDKAEEKAKGAEESAD